MSPLTLIPKQTGAEATVKFFKITADLVPATLIAAGFTSGTEIIPVLFSVDDGATSEPVVQDTTTITLTKDKKIFAVNSPMTIGVTKPVTVQEVGVFLALGANA